MHCYNHALSVHVHDTMTSLLPQDMMSHLHGSWHFKQLEAPSSTSLGTTHVTYCFEMWPKGGFEGCEGCGLLDWA